MTQTLLLKILNLDIGIYLELGAWNLVFCLINILVWFRRPGPVLPCFHCGRW
jgi:hypothetical protein